MKKNKEVYLPYGKQNITEEDINEVTKVLKSDFLTQGPQIKKFEDLDNIIYRIIQNKENFKDENECLKFAFALRKTMFKGNIFDGSYLTKNNDLFLVESLKKLFSIYK